MSDTAPGKWGDYAVAIIGAGPAGCAAACEIARAGFSCILIEQGDRYRDKVCGDMLVPQAMAILAELGLTPDHCSDATRAGAVDLYDGDRLLWRVAYPGDDVWIIGRNVLDQALRDCLPAPANVRYGAEALDLKARSDGGFVVSVRDPDGATRSLTAGSVVVASGARNAIARAWGVDGEGMLRPSITAYLDQAMVDFPRFEFAEALEGGYRWIFPYGAGRANVGVCFLDSPRGARLKMLGDTWLERHGAASGGRLWRGGAALLWSGCGSRWHHEAGVVSCGDAAGLVDPVNGEGISAALLSGRAAGVAIAKFLESDRWPGLLGQYSQWVKSAFAAKYAASPVREAWCRLCGLATV